MADPSPAPPLDAATISKLIREELDRNNKTLEFVQGQIDKDRAFYKHLYSWAAGVIAVLAAIAALVSYSSIGQMRADIKASVDAELERDKAEIAALRAQAQTTVNTELQNVHTEVQKRVDTEFKSENITALVASAAKGRTNKELAGIIRSETAAQVSKGIEQEKPTIKKAVEDETKLAVRDLAPTIKDIATNESKSQVQSFIAPVQSQLTAYQELVHVDTLGALARSGDRKAFDELVALPDKTRSPDVRKVAETTVMGIIRDKNFETRSPLYIPAKDRSVGTLIRMMTSDPVVPNRLAALDTVFRDYLTVPGGPDTSLAPALVQVINNDDNIDVIVAAFNVFDAITLQHFRFPDSARLNDWWNANKDRYMKK